MFSLLALVGISCSHTSVPASPELIDKALEAWGDDMTYGFLSSDESDGKQALRTAKKNSEYADYYARFKVGKLCIVEGSTPPPRWVMDGEGSHGTCAVILDKNAIYIELPNKKLLAHYMKHIRQNPAQHKPERRYSIMRVLGGFHEPMFKSQLEKTFWVKDRRMEAMDPTWIEENGTLTIEYISTRSDSSMEAPYPIKCKLVFNAEQQYTEQCEPVFND